jgi:N-acetylmuramoyl-L-alanine amidase
MNKFCVFLDNGHGINTKGKCSPCKTLCEWNYCREIVKRIKEQLDQLGVEYFEVTPEDKDISLSERVKRINNKYSELKANGYACCLISIHLNAAKSDGKWHNASGFSVWISKNASNNSKKLATIIHKEAMHEGLSGNRWYPTEKYFVQNWTILYKSYCPAILSENLFMDNVSDKNYLLSEDGKETITRIHLNTILKYKNSL